MDQQASKTALMVAAYRARATARPEKLCQDEWAARLAGDDGMEHALRYDAAWPPAELWLALRTAAIDREVRRWIGPPHGMRQVVILGAGFDTRAERLATPGVRWFEVDHPDTQADKLRRLRALGDYPLDAATFVSCDFEKEEFLSTLTAAGFDTKAPAFFVWEGVVLYLEEAAVRGTLRTVAERCSPSSVLLFDYVGKAMARGDVTDADDRAVVKILADLVEPIRFGIDDVVPLLHDEGFRWVQTRSFDELCLELAGTYDRARKFRFQRLALTSKTRPAGL